LAVDPTIRSNTSICLQIIDPWFTEQSPDEQRKAVRQLSTLLEIEGVAYDVNGYRDAPPGLRIWGGATVEVADITILLTWLDWAYSKVKNY
jgi:phosphoserine aminotransferase